MKFAKPGPARTAELAERLRGNGASSAVAGVATREEPVTAQVSGALLEFAMRDAVRISAMMVSGAFVRRATMGRGVRKVCFIS